MKINKCNHCDSIITFERNNKTKDENLVYNQIFSHPSLTHIDSSSGWVEFITTYYCNECHSVLELYDYSPIEEDREDEYALRFLTDERYIERKKRYLLSVGEHLLSKDKAKKIRELISKEGHTTVYLSGHVDQFKKLQLGFSIPLMDLRNELFTTFEELLCSYWQVRWFVNCRYYIKVDVPNNAFNSIVQSSENHLGSGQDSFNLKSNYIVKVEEIKVFDPKQSKFVPLSNWNVPPEYNQSSDEVNELFGLYKPVIETHKPLYDEVKKKEEYIVKELTSSMYGVSFEEN